MTVPEFDVGDNSLTVTNTTISSTAKVVGTFFKYLILAKNPVTVFTDSNAACVSHV